VLSTVVLDVGETLVDETAQWLGWADWLGVTPLTLLGCLGGLIARGIDHREVVPLIRPGRTFEQERDARLAAGGPWPAVQLYPDARACLQALRDDGWRVVVGGNQPEAFQRLVEQLDLPVDRVTSSGELGAEKPSPEFFRRIAATVAVAPNECVHVGDRVDNDVVGALTAGDDGRAPAPRTVGPAARRQPSARAPPGASPRRAHGSGRRAAHPALTADADAPPTVSFQRRPERGRGSVRLGVGT